MFWHIKYMTRGDKISFGVGVAVIATGITMLTLFALGFLN